ncbi:hypothetical protein P7H60_08830 [Vagococcus carniphilus]|uniref:hypothetical protein n=1 Tax=Vagococcus carniphilus TaxID=218144 RepID=UPI00288DE205|nr:hypothetical protein [Vagococcus carniphilus]MDT2849268.1 hypothetical protein [Vagococcus carniphilus]
MKRSEHLLVCLMEECAEVQQAVAKSLRFGLEDHHPKRPDLTNEAEILTEFYQLVAVMDLLQEEEMISSLSEVEVERIKKRKLEKLDEYMEYSRNSCHLIED